MAIRVGINGFGRIGRNFFRAAKLSGAKIEFVAVNDLGSLETLAHLLKNDSVHGKFGGSVKAVRGGISVDGQKLAVLSERNPGDLPWGDLGVDVVIESTGIFADKEKAQPHIEAGAKKVFFASAAPPIRFQNVYGIDMAATTELIAHQKDEDQIAEYIGADWLVYQNLEDLIRSAKEGNKEIENFETSIFDGEYLDDQVSSDYLKNLEVLRSDSNKI